MAHSMIEIAQDFQRILDFQEHFHGEFQQSGRGATVIMLENGYGDLSSTFV